MVPRRRIVQLSIGVICATALALCVAACGSSGGSSSSSSTSASAGSECKAKHPGLKTIKSGTLTVANVNAMPYIEGEGSEAKGVDGKIVTTIAEMECLNVNFTPLSGSAALPAVQSGRADIAAGGWYRTPEREKEVGQTEAVWYDFSAVATKGGTVKNVDGTKGMNVGVVQGSLFVKPLEEVIGSEHVKLYQSTDAIWQDISVGRLEATVDGSAAASYQAKEKPSLGFEVQALEPTPDYPPAAEPGEVNYPHSKSDTELTEALNEDIAELRKNGIVKEALNENGLTNPNNFEPTS